MSLALFHYPWTARLSRMEVDLDTQNGLVNPTAAGICRSRNFYKEIFPKEEK